MSLLLYIARIALLIVGIRLSSRLLSSWCSLIESWHVKRILFRIDLREVHIVSLCSELDAQWKPRLLYFKCNIPFHTFCNRFSDHSVTFRKIKIHFACQICWRCIGDNGSQAEYWAGNRWTYFRDIKKAYRYCLCSWVRYCLTGSLA